MVDIDDNPGLWRLLLRFFLPRWIRRSAGHLVPHLVVANIGNVRRCQAAPIARAAPAKIFGSIASAVQWRSPAPSVQRIAKRQAEPPLILGQLSLCLLRSHQQRCGPSDWSITFGSTCCPASVICRPHNCHVLENRRRESFSHRTCAREQDIDIGSRDDEASGAADIGHRYRYRSFTRSIVAAIPSAPDMLVSLFFVTTSLVLIGCTTRDLEPQLPRSPPYEGHPSG